MKLRQNLIKLRYKKGLSQQELSDKNRMVRSSYAGYERGVANPPLCVLIRLADFYGVSLDKLIR